MGWRSVDWPGVDCVYVQFALCGARFEMDGLADKQKSVSSSHDVTVS
jgi:hypothetical protein